MVVSTPISTQKKRLKESKAGLRKSTQKGSKLREIVALIPSLTRKRKKKNTAFKTQIKTEAIYTNFKLKLIKIKTPTS